MSWLYRTFVRPALFTQDGESIHNFTLKLLAQASRSSTVCRAVGAVFRPPPLPVSVWGLNFPNPVGLAAGMDKEAEALPAWHALGFGFTELGAVTWHPQPGNPKPRVFRAIPEGALVNRMGFNNPGAEVVAERLARWRESGLWPAHPVGMNLGKSKITPLADASDDYAKSLRVLWPHLDFFVVNVSSPNTPNLRELQDKRALDEILAALQEVNGQLAAAASAAWVSSAQGAPAAKPILVKIAPDLSFSAMDEILELVEPRKISGLVATNTTLARPETPDPKLRRVYSEAGGLSGRPLRVRSTEVVRHLAKQTQGKLPLIAVGGIFTAADAWEKITAGATLVQVYTGLVFEGPGVVKGIVRGLKRELTRSGLVALADAKGLAARG